jgi:hypothetical protein
MRGTEARPARPSPRREAFVSPSAHGRRSGGVTRHRRSPFGGLRQLSGSHPRPHVAVREARPLEVRLSVPSVERQR